MSLSGADYEAIAAAHGGDDDDSSSSSDQAGRDFLYELPGPPVEEIEIFEENTAPEPPPKKQRRTHSIAHEQMGRFVLLSVDLETGGEEVGVIQLSCVAHNLRTDEKKEFDEYIRPPDKIRPADWNDVAISITGIQPNGPEMRSAKPIEEVYPQFVKFCEDCVPDDHVGCLVAWNGIASDCKWLFKLVEEDHKNDDRFRFPQRMNYYMDPIKVISHYKGCKLNKKHSGVLGYGLAEMYIHCTGMVSLEGAHSSIVDARAQLTVVTDERFKKYIDKPESILHLDSVWAAKRSVLNSQLEELERAVPDGWVTKLSQLDQSPVILTDDQYNNSYSGGAAVGPTNHAKTACEDRDLAKLFMSFWPVVLLQNIAKQTNKYGNEDWVRPARPGDEDASVAEMSLDDDSTAASVACFHSDTNQPEEKGMGSMQKRRRWCQTQIRQSTQSLEASVCWIHSRLVWHSAALWGGPNQANWLVLEEDHRLQESSCDECNDS